LDTSSASRDSVVDGGAGTAAQATRPRWSKTKECRERLTLDERVVALDPAVRGEDEEVEPDSERPAVLGDRLPVELD
jgi:hypothetical protein